MGASPIHWVSFLGYHFNFSFGTWVVECGQANVAWSKEQVSNLSFFFPLCSEKKSKLHNLQIVSIFWYYSTSVSLGIWLLKFQYFLFAITVPGKSMNLSFHILRQSKFFFNVFAILDFPTRTFSSPMEVLHISPQVSYWNVFKEVDDISCISIIINFS